MGQTYRQDRRTAALLNASYSRAAT